MIRAQVLPHVLNQIVGDGVDTAMLMTLDGALMGSVGKSDRFDHKVIGAIASNIWSEYLHSGKEINVGHPDFLLLDLENGTLGITSAGKNFLLCAYTTGEAQPGLLKAKLQALGTHLSASLDQIGV